MDQADFGPAPVHLEQDKVRRCATRFANLSPFSHAVPSRGSASPNQVMGSVQEFVCGRSVPAAALSVKGPAKNQLSRTIMVSSQLSEPMVNQRGLPDTGPGNDRNDVDIFVCPCAIQESDVLISTKNIASGEGQFGYGNLLRSSLASGSRDPIREAVGSAFCRLSRMILRSLSIASATVGIAFKSSVVF